MKRPRDRSRGLFFLTEAGCPGLAANPIEHDATAIAPLPRDPAEDCAIAAAEQKLTTFGRKLAPTHPRPAEAKVFDEHAPGSIDRRRGAMNADGLPPDPPPTAWSIDPFTETRHALFPPTSLDCANNCTLAREVQQRCRKRPVAGRGQRPVPANCTNINQFFSGRPQLITQACRTRMPWNGRGSVVWRPRKRRFPIRRRFSSSWLPNMKRLPARSCRSILTILGFRTRSPRGFRHWPLSEKHG